MHVSHLKFTNGAHTPGVQRPTGCSDCRGCGLAFTGPPPAVSPRAVRRVSFFCLGLPLVMLIAGVWLAELLAPGQAWLVLPAFAGVSAAVAGAGSRVEAWLIE